MVILIYRKGVAAYVQVLPLAASLSFDLRNVVGDFIAKESPEAFTSVPERHKRLLA